MLHGSTKASLNDIELLEDHKELDKSRTPHTSSNSIAVANLLKGVEKSYDSGKFLLDESEKFEDWLCLQ